MVFYFPEWSLERFRVTSVSLEGHPFLEWNFSDDLYDLKNPESNEWRYFQFRLLGDVPRNLDDWTISSEFVAAKRIQREDFSALVVGVWTGVSPPPLQVALFHAGHTAYTLFKKERLSVDHAWGFGKGVARSYISMNCPEHLETLDHYLKTS